MNTSQQIGGAVGIAILSTVATSTTNGAGDGTPLPVALTDGFQAAFWTGAAIAFAGVLVSIFLVRGRDLQPQESEAPVAEAVLEAA
jgi:Na+/melibiose symporter-like transporter